MSLHTHFRAMAENNAWSNRRLLRACRPLSETEIWAPRTSFFPSIGATLNHILIVDWFYVDALTSGGRGRSVYALETPYRAIEDLACAQMKSDGALTSFCASLEDGDLSRSIVLDRGPRGQLLDTIGAVLPHLFTHQIHHRGQVHAMLSGTPIKPPQLDEFFLAEDRSHREEAEMKEAGN